MSFGRGFAGLGTFASLFATVVSVAACSSESESGDDESDDDSGGGTFPGGGTGGTVGTGGAMATGGTSSISSQCAIFCQRTVACPDPDPAHQPCQENCVSSADAAASVGCANEYRRALDCLATVADPCAEGACAAELEALLIDCVGDTTPGGCAPTGTGPASGDCVALCQETNACPGEEPLDCATTCSDAAAQAAMYGCTTEMNRLYGCASTCTNHCAFTANDCPQELVAYTDCIVCGIQPSSPDCTM